jgi:hypothetical protein
MESGDMADRHSPRRVLAFSGRMRLTSTVRGQHQRAQSMARRAVAVPAKVTITDFGGFHNGHL